MQTRLMGNMMENGPFALLGVKTAINGNFNFWNGIELGLFIFNLQTFLWLCSMSKSY